MSIDYRRRHTETLRPFDRTGFGFTAHDNRNLYTLTISEISNNILAIGSFAAYKHGNLNLFHTYII